MVPNGYNDLHPRLRSAEFLADASRRRRAARAGSRVRANARVIRLVGSVLIRLGERLARTGGLPAGSVAAR